MGLSADAMPWCHTPNVTEAQESFGDLEFVNTLRYPKGKINHGKIWNPILFLAKLFPLSFLKEHNLHSAD